MIQFYSPDITRTLELPEDESQHCVRVLRMKEGDEINVIDGKGKRYLCEIENADPRHTKLRILSEEDSSVPRNYSLTIAIAPTKNADRIEWLVEKAVEIGVDRIVLLKCRRSERKILRKDRLEKIMISAMKQSLGVTLPTLDDMVDFKQYVEETDLKSQKFFGYCSETVGKSSFVKECKPGGEVIVMIGPEGDFTQEEVKLAIEKGFKAVTFGEKRLRTETAGVFAICAVNVINQLL